MIDQITFLTHFVKGRIPYGWSNHFFDSFSLRFGGSHTDSIFGTQITIFLIPRPSKYFEKHFLPLGRRFLEVGTRILFLAHEFQFFLFPDHRNTLKNNFYHLAHMF